VKKAFSLVELLVAIALSGVMAALFYNYVNYAYYKNQSLKTTIQTHFSSITAAILHCKSVSDLFATQAGGVEASDTPVSELECQSSPPFMLDGYDAFFMPKAPSGFDAYSATQSGNAFYIKTAVDANSDFTQALYDLNASYSSNQYELALQGGKLEATYYISR
jgi:prepilin-type N-terminal cleavage/methylation domain-containing protein